MTHSIFHRFTSLAEAKEYRKQTGCGGWIFGCEGGGESIIFPPKMTPSEILVHDMIKGKSGTLYS